MTDWPDDTLPSMALYLARHMTAIRRHEAAADIVAEVTAAVRHAVRVIDRPAQRVYAGPCPTCRTDLLAPPGRTQVTCSGCGTTHDIAERQDHMRTQLDDYLGTATYAAAILPGIGIHVSAGTIRVWASRHRLAFITVPAHGPSPEQHLYRLGDIVDLALARDARAGLEMAKHRLAPAGPNFAPAHPTSPNGQLSGASSQVTALPKPGFRWRKSAQDAPAENEILRSHSTCLTQNGHHGEVTAADG